jgi:hypothetical protein
MIVTSHAPNMKNTQDATATTTWHIVSGYPGLDLGVPLQSMTVESFTSAAAAGSAFFFATNLASAPSDDTKAVYVPGGQPFTIPGGINNLWIRKTATTDLINIVGLY